MCSKDIWHLKVFIFPVLPLFSVGPLPFLFPNQSSFPHLDYSNFMLLYLLDVTQLMEWIRVQVLLLQSEIVRDTTARLARWWWNVCPFFYYIYCNVYECRWALHTISPRNAPARAHCFSELIIAGHENGQMMSSGSVERMITSAVTHRVFEPFQISITYVRLIIFKTDVCSSFYEHN